MRRIRNITNDVLEVPLLGASIEPGDVVNVPDDLDYLDFSPAFFEVEAAPKPRKNARDVDSGEVN